MFSTHLPTCRRTAPALAVFWLATAAARAQSPLPPMSIASPQTMTTGSGGVSPLAIYHTEHMAQVLGNSVSGDGTRYFAVTSQSLAGAKNSAEVIKRLTPEAVKPQDGVRQVEVVVDLPRPLILHAAPGQTVELGTVTVNSPTQIDVNSYIHIPSLTVIGNEKSPK